jgi:hypothetical protein
MPSTSDPLLPVTMPKSSTNAERKRVLVVGAGAAGELHMFIQNKRWDEIVS